MNIVYLFFYFITSFIINRNYVLSQVCETDTCLAHAEDLAYRMWSMASLRENVFTNFMKQLAKSRHYQLALWHMTIAAQFERGDVHANMLSNDTKFVEPDISEVYRKEIQHVVNEFIHNKHNDALIREMHLDETQHVIDEIWAQICSMKLSITQSLVAAILRRQAVMHKHNSEIKDELKDLTDRLHKNSIPAHRWKAIVQLTSRSLCSSDLCPWLHRIVEQAEHYLIEETEETGYTIRIAHLVKSYCQTQTYAVIDEFIGHEGGSCDPFSQNGDSLIYIAIPNPKDLVDRSFYDEPGSILIDAPEKSTFHDSISNLKKLLNKVESEEILDKFGESEYPNKLDYFKYLLDNDEVKSELEDNPKLKNIKDALVLFMSLADQEISDANLNLNIKDFSRLTKFLPVADNDDEQDNLDQLKLLLSDVKELENLFGNDTSVFDGITSETELLGDIIRTVIMNSFDTNYTFTSGIYTVLEKLIESKNNGFHVLDDNSDPDAKKGLSPLDTLIVEVDPSRLDRKPRFSQPGGFYSENMVRPKSKYTVQYTIPSPVLSLTDSDTKHLDELLPSLPDSEENEVDNGLLKQVKRYLKDETFRDKILDENFDKSQYPTKIAFLEYVFKRLITLDEQDEIDIDPALDDFIALYYDILQFTNEELGVAPKAVMKTNYAELLMLLPEPLENETKKFYEEVESLMLDDDHLDYIVRDMNHKIYNTQEKILKYILNECAEHIEGAGTRKACNHYKHVEIKSVKAHEKPEKHVVYVKANLEPMDFVYVQFVLNNVKSSNITDTLQPPRKGVLQIPIPDKTLGVDAKDMIRPSRMIPDIDSSFDIYYNMTDLKWQIRRQDTLNAVFEDKFNWRKHNTKVLALSEIIDRMIAISLSDDLFLQQHSLNFAKIYSLALKIGTNKLKPPKTKKRKFDFNELLEATLALSTNQEFLDEGLDLLDTVTDAELMQEILGPNFYPELYKNDVTLLRAILNEIIESDHERVAHVKNASLDVLEFLKQFGYNIQLVTSIEHKEIDMSGAIDAALDRRSLPKTTWAAYRKVLKFMIQNLDVDKHLLDFDFNAYTTKAELIHGILKFILEKRVVDDEVLMSSIKILLPKINFNGRGAEPI